MASPGSKLSLVLSLIFLFMVGISSEVYANKPLELKELQTRGGLLKVEKLDGLNYQMKLGNKIVYERADNFYNIDYYFVFDNYTVVFIESQCSGSGCFPMYQVLTVYNNGTFKTHPDVSIGYIKSIKKQKNKIVCIASHGVNNNQTYTYENGNIRISAAQNKSGKLAESDYKELFRIYKDSCTTPEKESDKPSISGGYGRAIAQYRDDKRFSETKYYKLCDETYTYNKINRLEGSYIKYNEFKKRITNK